MGSASSKSSAAAIAHARLGAARHSVYSVDLLESLALLHNVTALHMENGVQYVCRTMVTPSGMLSVVCASSQGLLWENTFRPSELQKDKCRAGIFDDSSASWNAFLSLIRGALERSAFLVRVSEDDLHIVVCLTAPSNGTGIRSSTNVGRTSFAGQANSSAGTKNSGQSSTDILNTSGNVRSNILSNINLDGVSTLDSSSIHNNSAAAAAATEGNNNLSANNTTATTSQPIAGSQVDSLYSDSSNPPSQGRLTPMSTSNSHLFDAGVSTGRTSPVSNGSAGSSPMSDDSDYSHTRNAHVFAPLPTTATTTPISTAGVGYSSPNTGTQKTGMSDDSGGGAMVQFSDSPTAPNHQHRFVSWKLSPSNANVERQLASIFFECLAPFMMSPTQLKLHHTNLDFGGSYSGSSSAGGGSSFSSAAYHPTSIVTNTGGGGFGGSSSNPIYIGTAAAASSSSLTSVAGNSGYHNSHYQYQHHHHHHHHHSSPQQSSFPGGGSGSSSGPGSPSIANSSSSQRHFGSSTSPTPSPTQLGSLNHLNGQRPQLVPMLVSPVLHNSAWVEMDEEKSVRSLLLRSRSARLHAGGVLVSGISSSISSTGSTANLVNVSGSGLLSNTAGGSSATAPIASTTSMMGAAGVRGSHRWRSDSMGWADGADTARQYDGGSNGNVQPPSSSSGVSGSGSSADSSTNAERGRSETTGSVTQSQSQSYSSETGSVNSLRSSNGGSSAQSASPSHPHSGSGGKPVRGSSSGAQRTSPKHTRSSSSSSGHAATAGSRPPPSAPNSTVERTAPSSVSLSMTAPSTASTTPGSSVAPSPVPEVMDESQSGCPKSQSPVPNASGPTRSISPSVPALARAGSVTRPMPTSPILGRSNSQSSVGTLSMGGNGGVSITPSGTGSGVTGSGGSHGGLVNNELLRELTNIEGSASFGNEEHGTEENLSDEESSDEESDAYLQQELGAQNRRHVSLYGAFKNRMTSLIKTGTDVRIARMAFPNADDELIACLSHCGEWEFDVFLLDRLSKGHPLQYVSMFVFYKLDLLNKFKIGRDVLDSFVQKVESLYTDTPYHNCVHAADVLQSFFVFLTHPEFDLQRYLTDIDRFAAIVACIGHDVGHHGLTNAFHIRIQSDLALTWNDVSVMENYHTSTLFKVLSQSNYNIIAGLDSRQYRMFRDTVVSMILATDMSLHFDYFKKFSHVISTDDKPELKLMLQVLLKCADISNPTRPLHLYNVWVDRLMEEFFRQGDRERERADEIPISPFMDRQRPNVPKCQLTFIDVVVKPLFETVVKFTAGASILLDYLEENRKHWEDRYVAHTSAPSSARTVSSPSASTSSVPPSIQSETQKATSNKSPIKAPEFSTAPVGVGKSPAH